MLPVLLIFALLVSPAAAQRPRTSKKTTGKPAVAAPKPAPDRWPLAAIYVSGNKVFPSDAIVRATGLKLGPAVNKADFEAAVQRLTATGAFETISFRYTPEGDKLSATFEVQEVVDLYPVGFERLEIPDAELTRVLSEKVPLFGPQVPATGAMVKRIVAALESYLAARNQETRVIGRLVSAPGGKLVMTFRPAEQPPSITFVKFENSTVLRAEDLQKAFYQVALGIPYTEERLRELLDHNIRPLFEEKGRLQVRFGPFRTEESKEPAGLVVTVPVAEGEEFHFGKVRFAGNTKLPERELGRLVKLEEDQLANFALVNKAVADIEARYKRDGYVHVKATAERALVQKAKAVELVIRIQEGDRYTFRNLEIKGIDINAAAAVRKRWAIQRGQPFDDSYPGTFLKRIEEEAMFDRLAKTAYHVTVDEESKMVDVQLEFVGEPAKRKVVR